MNHAIDRFLIAYKKFYGHKAVFTIKGKCIYVQGYNEKLFISSLAQITRQYVWRLNNNCPLGNVISVELFDIMDNWISTGVASVKSMAVALDLSYKPFQDMYRITLSTKAAFIYTTSKRCRVTSKVIEFDGKIGTTKQWANTQGISSALVRERIRRHGVCFLAFLTPDDYRRIPETVRKKHKNRVNLNDQGKRGTKSHKDENPLSLSHKQCLSLIEYLIIDSKKIITKGSKAYQREAQEFLKNKNGQLEFLLEGIDGINLALALQELSDFVDNNRRVKLHVQ